MSTTNLRTVPFSEVADLPIYAVADIFPMLPEKAEAPEDRKSETITLAELAISIKENGLQEPLVLFTTEGPDGFVDTFLLDGRNRRAACKLAKIEEVQVQDFEGTQDEADEYVFALNIDRRDLTPGQRAFVAVEYEHLVSNLRPGQRAIRELAARFRVSNGYLSEAKRAKKQIEDARTLAERSSAEADRQREIAKEKAAAAEAALEAGDEMRARDARAAANAAHLVAMEEAERAAAAAQKAATKSNEVDRVKSGAKSMGSLVKKSPGQEIAPDSDAIGLALKHAKEAENKLLEAIEIVFKADAGESKFNAQQNLVTKIDRIVEKMSDYGWVEWR